MAVSRVKTWIAAEVLYAADLNAEFDNILNNGLSVVSPWTANMDAGGFRLIGLAAGTEASPTLQPTGDTNTGVRFSAADTIDLVTGGADRWQITSAGHLFATDDATYDIGASGATRPRNYYGSGTATFGGLVTGAGFTGTGNVAITPAAVSGTPAQHGLFQANVLKGWVNVSYAAAVFSLADSFNVSSITDGGAGNFTIVWDRDFADTTYAVAGMAGDNYVPRYGTPAVGSMPIVVMDMAGTATDAGPVTVIAVGDQ